MAFMVRQIGWARRPRRKRARVVQVCMYGRRVRNVRASLLVATPSLFLRENVVAETPTSMGAAAKSAHQLGN